MGPHITSTFSIIAHDPATGRVGAGAASCVLGVGGRVLRYRMGDGLVVTQHADSAVLADTVLRLVDEGTAPREAISRALAADADASQRQVLCINFNGQHGAWTGGGCTPVAASAARGPALAAGNCLASDAIPDLMLDAYEATHGQPLTLRLLAALRRAADEGADRRGLESAAILSVPPRPSDWRNQIVDLRVDLHKDPVGELHRLYHVFQSRFGAQ